MTSPIKNYLLAALVCSWSIYACSSSNQSSTATATDSELEMQATAPPAMEKVATAFVASLDKEQEKKALYTFDDAERKNWHFVPKIRGGLPLREMNTAQQELVKDLLETVLSEQGQEKAEGIMQLERVLQELEGHPYENDRRNPKLYYLAIFGDPSGEEPWGWRYEGHHLSLNFSSVDRKLSVTPAFWGSNPAIVRTGDYTGTEVLKKEQDLGRELVHMFSNEQAGKAILPDPAPKDIITFVQQKVELDTYSGLPVSAFNAEQKTKVEELLGVYLNNMKPEIAKEHWEKMMESGIDQLYFAWMGGTEPGDPHYYRIHGPTLLIEYDNVQNGNNHIHTVWRDLTDDFGEDLLREHYAHGHKH